MMSHWTYTVCTSCLAVCLLYFMTQWCYVSRESHELCTMLQSCMHTCALVSYVKHSIYTKQCHIHMINSTVQPPSSWTMMAGMLIFHDHPFYNQICWPVVPDSDNNHNATAGLSVSFPHYPATARITLSSVFRLLVQCSTTPLYRYCALLDYNFGVWNLGESPLAPTAASHRVGTK